MLAPDDTQVRAGVFITFSGNCKKALTFYQTCFGGKLYFETFPASLPGYTDKPLISGSLISSRIVIHGSDLVHNEGRKVGNYLSVFLSCKSAYDRKVLLRKLESEHNSIPANNEKLNLVEVTDAFDVKWVLGIF